LFRFLTRTAGACALLLLGCPTLQDSFGTGGDAPDDDDVAVDDDDDDDSGAADDDDDSGVTDDDDDSGVTDDDDDDSALHGDIQIEDNPFNPLSAVVRMILDRDVTVRVEYGEAQEFDLATPTRVVSAGVETEVLVMGLREERQYGLQVNATDGKHTWTLEAPGFATEAQPGAWHDCEVEFAVPEETFQRDEAICTHGVDDQNEYLYYCVDRWGEVVLIFRHPEDMQIPLVHVMPGGGWIATTGFEPSVWMLDDRGEMTQEWLISDFNGITRFSHYDLDWHDALVLTEGPWAGAVALITRCNDVVGGAIRDGEGILVFDPLTGQVLWDWSPHGAPGDETPIDPLLDYERQTLGESNPDWIHSNALLHGLDDDGGQFFWISARSQDWMIKIDVDTDEVVWRFGFGGDFDLVEDLDDPTSPALAHGEWFFHPHAPEWTFRQDSRTRFLVFDNGNVRATDEGELSTDPQYSRIVEFEMDEVTMRASVVFDWGERDAAQPGHFYSSGNGDADMLPSGDGVMVAAGFEAPSFLADIAYPDAIPRWTYSCMLDGAAQGIYRVNTFETLYETVH
jgi:hypothetical protein